MFGVAKYSDALEALRKERGVEGLFQHNLVAVDSKSRVATFKNLGDGGKEVQREFDFLHVVPPQKPWDWVAKSPLGEWISNSYIVPFSLLSGITQLVYIIWIWFSETNGAFQL